MKTTVLNALKQFILRGATPAALPPRSSPRNDPPNKSASATAATLQSALRSAENGDTRELFALYRDLTGGHSHIMTEFGKRKMALLSQPQAILPADKDDPDAVAAADACRQFVDGCENWMPGLVWLLDGTLYPAAVAQKVLTPAPPGSGLRYLLRRIEPVDYQLLCYRKPYHLGTPLQEGWEPDLALWPQEPGTGRIRYSIPEATALDPATHIVHRSHLLVGQRDNWGGPLRALLFWWFLSLNAREWFARYMDRYGAPFIVGKTDAKDSASVDFLEEQFATATKLFGLVVDYETQVELKEATTSGAADAYDKFLGVCHREMSKVIVGQDLSAQSAPTGLGSGVANLQGDVREDIRQFDQAMLAHTLRTQVFAPLLALNGIRGPAPRIVWGGLADADALGFSTLLLNLSNAGFEPDDESLCTVSEKVGFAVRRKAPVAAPSFRPFPPASGANPTSESDPAFEDHLASGIRHPASAASLHPLSASVADQLGVPAGWLRPVTEFLAELERKAADQSLTDHDLQEFLSAAARRVPELFLRMDVRDLGRVIERGLADTVVAETRRQLRRHG
jgi:hypothetical protein